MSNTDIKIKLRRDTTANWQSVNPVLLQGEVGLEYNATMDEVIGIKIGDGSTAWNDLEYVVGSKVPTGVNFDNLAHNVHTDDTLTVKDNKLSVNVDNSTYADGTALTWNPDTNEFVYKSVASSGGGFKNLIINGDFQVWQRGKSFTINNDSMYTADRWLASVAGQSESLVNTCDPIGDDSVVLLYQFDGNVNDTCGNYNGIWHGNEQYDTGKFDQAAKFDGSSYVSTPVLTSAVNSTHSITVSLWINPIASGNGCVFTEASGSWHCSWIEVETDLSVYIRVWNLSTLNLGQIPANEWSHIILSYDSDAGVLYGYLNGVLVAQESGTRQVPWDNGADEQFWIGKGDSTNMGNGSNFTGLLDQVRIIKKAITTTEAQLLYKETKSQGELSVMKGEVGSAQDTSNTCDVFKDNSCVATYKFDGNANDASGSYNGIWSGNEQYDAGKWEQAAKFDGSSYVTASTPISDCSTFSVSLWWKWSGGDTNTFSRLFSIGNGTNTCWLGWGNDGEGILSGDETNIRAKTVLTDFTDYYHTVLVIDGSDWYLYLNGALDNSGTNFNPINNAFNSLNIGLQYNGAEQWKGLIDQVRIFNRALTAEEVKVLYSEQTYTVLSLLGATQRITSTPDYSTEYVKPFVYRFEGQHLYNQAIQGKKLTLSFDFKSTRTGIYSVALINKTDSSNIQSRIATFSYTTAGNMKRCAITFDLSEFTTPVNNDNQLGFELVLFGMTDDTNLIGQDGIMETSEKITTTTTVRLEKDDQIWIDRVQLEEGENATEFAPLVPQLSHLMSRRYYQIKADNALTTLFPLMRTDNPTVSGSGPYIFDAEIY